MIPYLRGLDSARSSLTRARSKPPLVEVTVERPGLGRLEIVEAPGAERDARNLELDEALPGALDRGELSVSFEPVVNLQSGATAGAEAHLRWYSKELGEVDPLDLAESANRLGIEVDLGEFVLDAALCQLVDWSVDPSGRIDRFVAVNVTSAELHQDFHDRSIAALRRWGVPASALRIECDESVIMDDVATSTEVLSRLRSSGIRSTVDHFGRGKSTLSRLNRLPVSSIKLNPSFLVDLKDRVEPTPVLAAVAGLARSLNLELCAAGVASESQRNLLVQAGFDYAQGPLFERSVTRPGSGSGR